MNYKKKRKSKTPKPASQKTGRLKPEHFLTQLTSLFSQEKEVKNYFQNELSWLEERHRFWGQHTWRVGLIGITSSGKSTLINSLIQEKLLPAKVRPTSNVLVHCSWGEKLCVEVIYETGKKQVLGQNIKQKLSLLADEETNPFNQKGIKEIRVFSPNFILGKEIVLVDTPGLDAVGQDRIGGHDDITLKLLLPTVDMVIYLMTCKVSSDKENSSNLSKIDNQKKPVLIVQNMIDAIRAKIGTGGKVEKDVDELLLENRQRLKKLLQYSQNHLVKTAPIVQVSAQWALDRKNYYKSNICILNETLKKMIEGLAPQLDDSRCEQIKKEVDNWLEVLKEHSQNKVFTDALKNHVLAIENLTQDLESDIRNNHQKLSEIMEKLENIERRGKELKAEKLSQNDQKKLEDGLNECRKFCEEFQKAFSGKINQIKSDISRFRSFSNLSQEDLMFSITQTTATFDTKIKTRTTTVTKKELRDTFGGKCARFCGVIFGEEEWGYDYVNEDQTNLNYSSFCKVVKEIFHWINNSDSNLKKFDEYVKKCFNRIIHKFMEDIKNCEAKQAIHLSPVQLKVISDKLSVISAEIASTRHTKAQGRRPGASSHPSSSKWREIEISKATHHLVALAHAISQCQLSSIRTWILEKHKISKNDIVFIWGKDQHLLNSFIRNFWHDEELQELKENESLIEKNANGNGKLVIVNECHLKTENRLARFKGKRIFCFYMFNLAQEGAASKHFTQSIIHKIQGKLTFIPVIDSCEEFITSQNFDELIDCFVKIRNTYFTQSTTAIINHANPLFSIFLHEVVYGHREFACQKDEIKFMQEIEQWTGDDSRALVSSALRNLGKRQAVC